MNQYKVYSGSQRVYIQADGFTVHENGSVSFFVIMNNGMPEVSAHLAVGTFTLIERVDLSNLFPEMK